MEGFFFFLAATLRAAFETGMRALNRSADIIEVTTYGLSVGNDNSNRFPVKIGVSPALRAGIDPINCRIPC